MLESEHLCDGLRTFHFSPSACRYAFVQFSSYFAAKNALESLNMTEVKGRPVAVDWVVPKDQYEQSVLKKEMMDDDNKMEDKTIVAERTETSDGSDRERDESNAMSHEDDGSAESLDDDDDDDDDDDVGSHDSDVESCDSEAESHDNDAQSHDSEDDDDRPGRREDTAEGKTIFIRCVCL